MLVIQVWLSGLGTNKAIIKLVIFHKPMWISGSMDMAFPFKHKLNQFCKWNSEVLPFILYSLKLCWMIGIPNWHKSFPGGTTFICSFLNAFHISRFLHDAICCLQLHLPFPCHISLQLHFVFVKKNWINFHFEMWYDEMISNIYGYIWVNQNFQTCTGKSNQG